MAKTINSKSIKDIFEALQQDFPEEAIKYRDYDNAVYISADDYRERLDEIIGPEHYNETYPETELLQTKDTLTIKAKCRLEILDDEFQVIMTKEYYGGSVIAFPKIDEKIETIGDDGKKEIITVTIDTVDKEGKPETKTCKIPATTTTSIPNDIASACQDAFKRLCKNCFSIGKRQLESAKKGTLYTVTVKSLTSKNGMIFGDILYKNAAYRFAVFKQYAESFKSTYGLSLNNQTISFYGKEGTDNYNKPQLVYEAPYMKNDSTVNSEPSKKNSASNENTAAKNNSSSKNTVADKNNSSTGNAGVKENSSSSNVNSENANNCNEGSNPHIPRLHTFKSASPLTELSSMPGSYKMTCDNNGQELTVIFLKEYIEQADPKKWNNFCDISSKKFHTFKVKGCEKDGKFYFASFAS